MVVDRVVRRPVDDMAIDLTSTRVRTRARLGRAPLALAVNVVAVGIALALPLGGYVILENLGTLAERVGAAPQLSVFFAMDAGKPEFERVETALKRAPGIRAVRFVPRDEALRELRQSESIGEIVANLDTNPLPERGNWIWDCQ